MSSFSESEPVFASRCLKVGLSEADIAKLKEQGITTLAKVAFCCSYTPGSGDDSELIRALKDALGQCWGKNPPSAGFSTKLSLSPQLR